MSVEKIGPVIGTPVSWRSAARLVAGVHEMRQAVSTTTQAHATTPRVLTLSSIHRVDAAALYPKMHDAGHSGILYRSFPAFNVTPSDS